MPDRKDQTWDDLYTDTKYTEELPPVDEEDPINEIEPAAASPEELESTAQTADPDIIEENTEVDTKDGSLDDDVPPPAAEEKPVEGEETKTEEDVNMSGIERYLSQFDIEGGMISFDDGSSSHFDELDATKQHEVLTQLHGASATSVEEKYGLDENEIGLINYLRTNSLSVEDMVEGMVGERMNTLRAIQDVETQDFDQMNEDGIYLQFLKRSNPEATLEQLEDDLGKAKEQATFPKLVDSLRGQFKQEQQVFVNSKIAEEQTEQTQLIEDQRQEVVNAVLGINDIAGVKINDNLKNNILDRVLEVNEYGDSNFMEDVFSEPTRLFNAAFWYYYGPSILEQRDNYWKQEKSRAYKRGQEEALGKDSTRISFTSAQKNVQQGVSKGSPDDEDDWLSLHT